MIYKQALPKVRLKAGLKYRAKAALKKQQKMYQSAHEDKDRNIIILYYKMLENGKKSHGQIDLNDLI